MKIYSIIFKKRSGTLITTETEIHQGFPSYRIYFRNQDFSNSAESGKIRTIIRNQGFSFPKGCVSTSIEPAIKARNCDIIEGATAVSVILSKTASSLEILILCPLSITGECRKINVEEKVIAEICKKNGISTVFLPSGNLPDNKPKSKISESIRFFYAKNLSQIVNTIQALTNSPPVPVIQPISRNIKTADPFESIIGLEYAKKALAVAVAGFHNILLTGPAGCGKSLLLSRLEKLIPETEYPQIKNDREHNISILQTDSEIQINGSASVIDMNSQTLKYTLCAGASLPPPVIAYNGRFLRIEETAQLSSKQMQLLRNICTRANVMKDGEIYPAKIALATAVNPCPCGRLGLDGTVCSCKTVNIEKHWREIRNNLLSIFELSICMNTADFSRDNISDSSGLISEIQTARGMQEERYRGNPLINFNSDIVRFGADVSLIRKEAQFFKGYTNPRELLILYSISRTLADMDGCDYIKSEHRENASMLFCRNPLEHFIS